LNREKTNIHCSPSWTHWSTWGHSVEHLFYDTF